VKDGPRLLDLYLEREITLEFHVSCAGTDQSELRVPHRHLGRDQDGSEELARLGVPFLDIRAGRADVAAEGYEGGVEYLMLVDVREPVEMPKGVRFRRVPSSVRLSVANEPTMVRQKTVVPPGATSLTQVFTTIREQRKRDLGRRPAAIFSVVRWAKGDGELPSDVIKAGVEVVRDLAKQDAPPGWRRRSFDDLPAVATRLRLELVQDSVRVFFVQKRPDLIVQRVDVFARPIELELSAV
jgi:hypothetical protein